MNARLQLYVLVCGLAVAGCGGKPTPAVKKPVAVVVKKPEPIKKPDPICVAASETENRIVIANGNLSSAQFCVAGGAAPVCYGVDLTSGEYSKLSDPPDAQPRGLEAAVATLKVSEKSIEVCVADACKPLKYKVNKAVPPTAVSINHAGTQVAIAAAKGVVEVWDVAANKKVSTIKFGKGDYRCGSPSFVGDALAISADVCAGPAARGALYGKAGKRLADVGGADFGTFGLPHTQVDNNTWAFLEESAGKLVLQDVVTGKVVKTMSLDALWSNGVSHSEKLPAIGQPGESALVRGGPGKLLVIGGSPGPGTVAVVDLDNGNVKITRALACAAN
ncbi:MAG TPA: hypothetical protein PLF40_12335 [Kofleriaceae bacterium]|nr:hypothetical protein [Kofleriaceae bacterium]